MLVRFFGLSFLITQAFATVNQKIEVIPDSYANATDNTLWRTLLEDCKIPTTQCVERNMYKYLKQVLEYPKDYSVTSFLKFARNSLNYTQAESDDSSRDDSDDDQQRSTMDEMSRTFQQQGVKFLMTHDLELQMPETFFEGATLKIAPRSLEGDGALVKMEFIPKEIPEGAVEGRIFFKKLKKKISQKLLYALLAILVVIKLLAVKFLFFLPMLMGVAAAKKLLIKILFFVFPAIKHLFKLCPYVPHGTKYHHHKHQIAHIHHLGGIHHHPHHHDDGIEIIHPHADGPPILAGSSLHHFVDVEPPHSPLYKPHEHDLEYYSGGPGLGEDIITNRKDPYLEDNEISGQGHGRPTKKNPKRPLTPAEIENMVLKAEKEALIKAKLQQERKRIQEENALLQEQLRQAIKIQEQLKLQQMNIISKTKPLLKNFAPTVPSPFLETPPPPPIDKIFSSNNAYSVPNQLMTKSILKYTGPQANMVPNSVMSHKGGVNEIFQGTASVSKQGAGKTSQVTSAASDKVDSSPEQGHDTQDTNQAAKIDFQKAIQKAASITYDPFYSPILMKIDKILVNLGYTDEPCKERLICFMYKSPEKYSPHSNLLSNELSRDAEELQKPTNPNAAVLRFFRYFQAARDGQEKNDCIKLYTGCNVLGSEL